MGLRGEERGFRRELRTIWAISLPSTESFNFWNFTLTAISLFRKEVIPTQIACLPRWMWPVVVLNERKARWPKRGNKDKKLNSRCYSLANAVEWFRVCVCVYVCLFAWGRLGVKNAQTFSLARWVCCFLCLRGWSIAREISAAVRLTAITSLFADLENGTF